MIKFIGTAPYKDSALLYYCQTEGDNEFFKVTISTDGFTFKDTSQYVFVMDANQKEEQKYNWENFRLAKQGSEYFMTYKEGHKSHAGLMQAFSDDMIRWQELGSFENITEAGAIVSDFTVNDKYIMYYGEKTIHIAYSSDLRVWKSDKNSVLTPREGEFDHTTLEMGNAYALKDYILLTYYVKKHNGDKTHYLVGAAYMDKANPSRCLYRMEEPLWEQPQQLTQESIRPLGCVVLHGEIILYFVLGENTIFAVSCQMPVIHETGSKKAFFSIVNKFKKNPIIEPNTNHPWESRATFNSAALYEDGKVHFLYRALGDTDLSVLGYAQSSDGIHIDSRSEEPAYIPREPFETPGGHAFKTFAQHFSSGGGYGGVEDPRITRVEDKVYLTYVAFDGATPPRAAISSIKIEDFLENNWDKWSTPKLISAPGMVNKSAVVFPRKVNGKYVVLHRVYPNILVDFLDNLEFDNYLEGHHFIPPRKNYWDSKKVGAGAPPMETKDGWLLIYQSVGYQDPSRYKIGAMMLDKNNPSKVLYRTHTPIIEPNEEYENAGFKAGVVYPCGAVIMGNKLNIYYGGADSVVCGASAPLDTFLDEMKHHQEPKLKKVNGPLF